MPREATMSGGEPVDRKPAEHADQPAVSPEAGVAPVELPAALMLEVLAHAREAYPEECCGLMLGPRGGPPERVVRCHNVQNRRRAQGESELDATRGFWIDERQLLAELRRAEARGDDLLVVYHSHPDAGPYLSRTDVQGALDPYGGPLWPGVGHLVVSVRDGAAREAALYRFDADLRAFVGRSVRLGT
jgi:[CysO sulfur-carrier protein]-S-L-cysteine hydrolase